MTKIARAIIVGGGMAVGMAASGVAAALDYQRMKKSSKKKTKDKHPVEIKPKYKRVHLWPS